MTTQHREAVERVKTLAVKYELASFEPGDECDVVATDLRLILSLLQSQDEALKRAREGLALTGLRDIFERPFDGEEDPRIRVAQCITRAEAEAILEHRGDMIAALSSQEGEGP